MGKLKAYTRNLKDRFSRSRSPQPNTASPNHNTIGQNSVQQSSTAINSTAGSTLTPQTGQTASLTGFSTPISGPPAGSSLPCPPNRNLWEVALQSLSQQDQDTAREYMPTNPNDQATAEALHQAAKAKQQECEDKRWKVQFNGRSIWLEEVARSVIFWLDKVKTVADVAANAQPVFAGLPWAGVKFLLLVSVSEKQQMDDLLRGLSRVSYILTRCQIYEQLYTTIGPSKETQLFESALITLYALILKFLVDAIRIYNRNTVSRGFNALKFSEDIIKFEEHYRDLEQRVDTEANTCERIFNREEFSQLKTLLEEIKTQSDTLSDIETGVAKIWKKLEDYERGKILQWTSSAPYLDHHLNASKERTKDTGEWIFECKNYKKWQSSDQSMILWLHGIPGAGKTKLISTVVDKFRARPRDHGLAYFYCNRNEDSRRHPVNIFRSFVKQLAMSRDEDAIQDALVKAYKEKQRSGFASAGLSLEECENIVLELIRGYSQTTMILDALDECEEKTRVDLLKRFNSLTERSQPLLKILISSRRDGDIKHRLEQKANIGISATDNADDISKFVSERIAQSMDDHCFMSRGLQDDIVETLLRDSSGMFQWAALQIDQILELELERDIRERLGRLPGSLKEAYDEIYTKIKNGKGSKPSIATRALQWVMCSAEPLKTDWLATAVSRGDGLSKDISTGFILDSCHNLLIVDASGFCRLSHLSVREYFEENHWDVSHTNGTVAKDCLSLMINTWNGGSEGENATVSDKALKYASNFWHVHVQQHGDTNIDNKVTGLLEEFLGSMNNSGPSYRGWHNYSTQLSRQPAGFSRKNRTRLGYHDITLGPSSPLQAILLFGFYHVLSKWWKSPNIEPEELNHQKHPVLEYAALGGSLDIVKRLLTLGADANMQSSAGEYGSALAAAATKSNNGVIQLLLDAGADPNMQLSCGEYGSSLAAATAAYSGTEKAMQLLLNAGADPNMQLSCGRYGSALAAAAVAYSEDGEVIQLLINAGADPNMQLSCGEYGSPLAAATAAYSGTEKAMQLLLNAGADPHMQLKNGGYGSALAAAATTYFGDKEAMQLLLNAGADPNMQLSYGKYGSALAAATAVYFENEPAIQLLLNAGADPNMQLSYGEYGSALAAAVSGEKEAVQLLLNAGADPNMQLSCGEYGSPLAAAAAVSHDEKIIQLLLNAGADPNMQLKNGRYGSALAAATAVYARTEPAIQLLLNAGADPNMQLSYGEYGSALAAAVSGEKEAVQLLLNAGADPNMQLSCGEYGSPLAAAAVSHDEKIIQLLLNAGADPNMQLSCKYGSALAAAAVSAAYSRNEKALQLLLNAGADPNMQLRGKYGSALAAVAHFGNKKVVQLLLDAGAIDVNTRFKF